MRSVVKSKLIVALAVLAIVAAFMMPLAGIMSHLHAAHANQPKMMDVQSTVSNVQGNFYSNPNNSGSFDVNPSSIPDFTQSFPIINFNPPQGMQACTNSTGVDENSRPFTDVLPYADGSCSTTVVQGNGQQAGLDPLSNFEAEFTASLTVAQSGQISFNVFADDGWIFSVGPDSNNNQPTAISGPMNNPPTNNVGPFTGYTVVAANNGPSAPQQFTVTVNFPTAGTYPIELDYTECCGGQLALVFNDLVTSTPTPLPSSTPTAIPGGVWIGPADQFVVRDNWLHFAAKAYPTNQNDPAIDHVNFTAWWQGVNPPVWHIACAVSQPTPGTANVYECYWNLKDVPAGPITVSFDVYDKAGYSNLAPNGTHQVIISPATIGWPFDPNLGQWAIVNGYRGAYDHQSGYAVNAFDFALCLPDKVNIATGTCDLSSGWPQTTGAMVYAPVSGTIAWGDDSCLGPSIDIDGHPGIRVALFHVNPLPGQTWTGLAGGHITQGEPIGTVSNNGCIGSGNHIHMVLYSCTDCKGDPSANRQQIPFSDLWTIGSSAYPDDKQTQNQYLSSLIFIPTERYTY